MKTTVDLNMFASGFCGSYKDNFTRGGLLALYNYLTDLEEDVGEELEFDPIALCCDYNEFANLKEFQGDYGDEYESIEEIEQKTTVIPIEGTDGFIIEVF